MAPVVYKRTCSALDADQIGPTHVLTPRDPNSDCGSQLPTLPKGTAKLSVDRMRSRKQTKKHSLPAQSNCRSQGSESSDRCTSPGPKYKCLASKGHRAHGTSYADAVHLNRDHETLTPEQTEKQPFSKIKTKRQQKKQKNHKNDEPSYAILKRDDASGATAFSVRPKRHPTFEALADQFVLTDECTAMMTHIDLNRSFERFPYTEMPKK